MPDKIDVSEDVKIEQIPISQIEPNDWNPNELSDTMFNRLVEDMQKIGFLQPILVVRKDDGMYRIIDGEHRYECGKLLDMETLPCVVVSGEFAEDEVAQKFQTMRMNMIRGNVDKRKLNQLISNLGREMPLEELAESLAYDDVDALRAMIEDTRNSLPPEMRKEFDKAKEEIKTVDDLSLVLNRLFTQYGNTLPYNYMVLDFGGKEHLWVRLKDKKAYTAIKEKADYCRGKDITFNSALLSVLNELNDEFIEKHQDEMEKPENDEE